MPEKPTRTILDAQVSFKRWETLESIVTALIKWASLFGIAWLFRDGIGMLAGKMTFADIAVRVIGNVKVSWGITVFLIGSGWVYGLGERALRRKHIKRTTAKQAELERLLDEHRTSSELTPTGTTPSKERRT
jgi:hypothetical protein